MLSLFFAQRAPNYQDLQEGQRRGTQRHVQRDRAAVLHDNTWLQYQHGGDLGMVCALEGGGGSHHFLCSEIRGYSFLYVHCCVQ